MNSWLKKSTMLFERYKQRSRLYVFELKNNSRYRDRDKSKYCNFDNDIQLSQKFSIFWSDFFLNQGWVKTFRNTEKKIWGYTKENVPIIRARSSFIKKCVQKGLAQQEALAPVVIWERKNNFQNFNYIDFYWHSKRGVNFFYHTVVEF